MVYKSLFVFLIGFFSCAFLVLLFSYSGFGVFGTGFVSFEGETPSNWIEREDIVMARDKIVLNIINASLSNYVSSGSMKPVLDSGATGIRIVPETSKEIKVGDIVSYRSEDKLIVHRVIEIGNDVMGVYFITQGDNNPVEDELIRFENIEYVTVGVLY